MKGNLISKIIKRTLLALLFFILIINIPLTNLKHLETTNDYNNWMKDNLKNDTLLVETKMLGAHDAFSSEINYTSPPDVSADKIMTGLPGALLKGYLIKQSVTQKTDVNGLLKNGVRYLDIRLTYDNDTWVTKHNFVSSDFIKIADDLVTYLNTYQGEFLILDFQHIDGLDYNSDTDYQTFLKMLEDTTLLDYQYVDSNKSLGEITYQEITNNKTTSKIIIIDKFTKQNKETYSYNETIRSSWANTDNFANTVTFLNDEASYIKSTTTLDDSFKVMQAVLTTQMTPKGIVDSLVSWSLIARAEDFNNYLINNEAFDDLMEVLPIIMVDYANCNTNDFVDNIMEKIIEANK